MEAMSEVDEFWTRKIAEAEAAGGRTVIALRDIPSVPGVMYALPGEQATQGKALVLTALGTDGLSEDTETALLEVWEPGQR